MNKYYMLSLVACLQLNTLFAQWSSLPMPVGRTVTSLAVNDGVLYAGGENFAMRSTDGVSWAGIPAIQFQETSSIATVAAENGHVYVSSYYGDELLIKSDDNGLTWDTIPTPLPYNLFYAGDRIFRVDQGIYFTDDNGQTWENVLTTAFGQYILDMVAWNGKLYLSGFSGLYTSSDNGSTWSSPNTSLGANGSQFPYLDLYNCGDMIFLYHYQIGLFRSFDGNNWELMPGTASMLIHDMVWFQDNIYMVNNDGLFVSQDSAATFTLHNDIPSSTSSFATNGNDLLIGCGSGIYKSSDNGQTWLTQNVNMPHLEFPTTAIPLDISSTGEQLIVSMDHKIYRDEGQGTQWRYVTDSGFGRFTEIGDALLYTSNYPRYYISQDDGINWDNINLPGTSISSARFAFGNGWLFLKHAGDTIVWRSPDFGNIWEALPVSFPAYFNEIAFAQSKLFLFSGNEVISSADDGMTWQPDMQGITFANPFYGVFSDGQRLLSVAFNGIYHYNAGEWHFTDAPTPEFAFNFPQFAASGIYIVAYNPAIPGEIWLSADEGQSWTNIGLSNPYIQVPYVQLTILAIHQGALYVQGVSPFDPTVSLLWRLALDGSSGRFSQGTVFLDENANNLQDNAEAGLENEVVSTASNYVLTDNSGIYRLFFGQIGDTIRPVSLVSPYVSYHPDFHILSQAVLGYDFAATKTPGIYDLCVNMVPLTVFRPGFSTIVALICQNPGTEATNGQLCLVKPAQLEYVSSSPLPVSISSDTLIWNIETLEFREKTNIQLELKTDVSTAIGTPLALNASLTLAQTDSNHSNNTDLVESIVVGSYDPNDKNCSPAQITTAMATDGEWLTYTIRFQNTGNYPASFVRILDTLSSKLEPSSLRVLNSSHPASYSLKAPGIFEVMFQDINLPDSLSDEPNSHGFVQFAVFLKPGLMLGDEVGNTADIFFDYNMPIRTNTARMSVEMMSRSQERSIADAVFFPNPASETVHIILPEAVSAPTTIVLRTSNGKIVMQDKFKSSFHVDKLMPGAYWMQVYSNEKLVATGKIIVI
jgi:uncharacterized repeat protein (TIGR01451 family)